MLGAEHIIGFVHQCVLFKSTHTAYPLGCRNAHATMQLAHFIHFMLIVLYLRTTHENLPCTACCQTKKTQKLIEKVKTMIEQTLVVCNKNYVYRVMLTDNLHIMTMARQ